MKKEWDDPTPFLYQQFLIEVRGQRMRSGYLKSKIFCDSIWEGGILIELPRLFEGEEISLQLTIPDFGALDGPFKVNRVKHSYDGENGKGYTQLVYLKPE